MDPSRSSMSTSYDTQAQCDDRSEMDEQSVIIAFSARPVRFWPSADMDNGRFRPIANIALAECQSGRLRGYRQSGRSRTRFEPDSPPISGQSSCARSGCSAFRLTANRLEPSRVPRYLRYRRGASEFQRPLRIRVRFTRLPDAIGPLRDAPSARSRQYFMPLTRASAAARMRAANFQWASTAASAEAMSNTSPIQRERAWFQDGDTCRTDRARLPRLRTKIGRRARCEIPAIIRMFCCCRASASASS